MVQQHSSPLLVLPAEIRSQIYEFALGGDIYRLKTSGQGAGFIQVRPNPLGLLLACRQIHKEARLISFVSNTFSFRTLDTRNSLLSTVQISLIRHIRIETFQFMAMLDGIGTPLSDECKMGLPAFRSVLHGVRVIEVLRMELPDFGDPYIIAEFYRVWHKQRQGADADYKSNLQKMVRATWPDAEVTFRSVKELSQVTCASPEWTAAECQHSLMSSRRSDI